jgi:site-specific recombinase XerD
LPSCTRAVCSEATTLEIGAIDRANQVLPIIGKVRQRAAGAAATAGSRRVGPSLADHHNQRWLFPNRHGDAHVNKRVLSDTFAAAVAAAGIQRGVTPHCMSPTEGASRGNLA